jgi:hypothetical protein
MNVERGLRGIAGVVVLASLSLAHFHHQNWLYLTGFVGLNLLQSAFSNWCPMSWLLQKCGVPRCRSGSPEAALKAK